MSQFHVCLVTHPKLEQARELAGQLVTEQLVACVNLVPTIESYYRWEGKVEHDQEVLLVMKTTNSLVERVIARVEALHPYDVPEVLFLGVEAGNKAYLDWLLALTVK